MTALLDTQAHDLHTLDLNGMEIGDRGAEVVTPARSPFQQEPAAGDDAEPRADRAPAPLGQNRREL